MADSLTKSEGTLSPETIDFLLSEIPVTLLPLMKKSSFYRQVRTFFQCVEDDDYESLAEEFDKLSPVDMILFFNKYGKVILNHSIVTNLTNKPLILLIDKVHPSFMQDMIRDNSYSHLLLLLRVQKQMEPYFEHTGKMTTQRELRAERYYLLLKIDYEGVKGFVNEHLFFMTPTMQEDFQKAVALREKEPAVMKINEKYLPHRY